MAVTKISNEQPFDINITGEKTKVNYTGTFRAKVVLSYSEEILKDRLYREALGPNPEYASPRVRDIAEMRADFAVSFVQTPLFWKSSNNGDQLYGDDNVLSEVWSKLQALRKEAGGTDADAEADRAKIEKSLNEPESK